MPKIAAPTRDEAIVPAPADNSLARKAAQAYPGVRARGDARARLGRGPEHAADPRERRRCLGAAAGGLLRLQSRRRARPSRRREPGSKAGASGPGTANGQRPDPQTAQPDPEGLGGGSWTISGSVSTASVPPPSGRWAMRPPASSGCGKSAEQADRELLAELKRARRPARATLAADRRDLRTGTQLVLPVPQLTAAAAPPAMPPPRPSAPALERANGGARAQAEDLGRTRPRLRPAPAGKPLGHARARAAVHGRAILGPDLKGAVRLAAQGDSLP